MQACQWKVFMWDYQVNNRKFDWLWAPFYFWLSVQKNMIKITLYLSLLNLLKVLKYFSKSFDPILLGLKFLLKYVFITYLCWLLLKKRTYLI